MNNNRIVFKGEYDPTRHIDDVIEQFSLFLDLSQDRVQPLFSGKTYILQKNRTEAEALAYQEQLDAIGVKTYIVSESTPTNASLSGTSENQRLQEGLIDSLEGLFEQFIEVHKEGQRAIQETIVSSSQECAAVIQHELIEQNLNEQEERRLLQTKSTKAATFFITLAVLLCLLSLLWSAYTFMEREAEKRVIAQESIEQRLEQAAQKEEIAQLKQQLLELSNAQPTIASDLPAPVRTTSTLTTSTSPAVTQKEISHCNYDKVRVAVKEIIRNELADFTNQKITEADQIALIGVEEMGYDKDENKYFCSGKVAVKDGSNRNFFRVVLFSLAFNANQELYIEAQW